MVALATKISVAIERWPFKRPFRITGHTFSDLDALVVTVERGGLIGRGEAAGVYYRSESAETMAAQVRTLAVRLGEATRAELLELMPAGGARNALDCALWDLEAQEASDPVWRLAGLTAVRSVLTTFTIGIEKPAVMADTAISYSGARALKLKLAGDGLDKDRVLAVRNARPDAWIGVDANQGFTIRSLSELMPTLLDAKVALIEQPFPVNREDDLIGLTSSIPIALDESVQDIDDLVRLADRCGVVNIKLDKCGGLTRALQLAAEARRLGIGVMVGNMGGTSLAMAPAFILGQTCDVVDLDGPIFLSRDRPLTVEYRDGYIFCPEKLWGSGSLPTGHRLS